MIYLGIGSRVTPQYVLDLMELVARRLSREGWTLRTGGSTGADDAFLRGHMSVLGWSARTEVHLPWDNFNGHGNAAYVRSISPNPEAYHWAECAHATWWRVRGTARRLLARNVYVALGMDYRSPADMVVTWTPDGSLDGRGPQSGGSGHTLRVLLGHNPNAAVWNLALAAHRDSMESFANGQRVELVDSATNSETA